MTKQLPITISRHAKRRMKWRGVTPEDVEAVVRSPDTLQIYPIDPTVTNAVKRIGGEKILVGYKVQRGEILVVTALKKGR